jgi:hypothetical protein
MLLSFHGMNQITLDIGLRHLFQQDVEYNTGCNSWSTMDGV